MAFQDDDFALSAFSEREDVVSVSGGIRDTHSDDSASPRQQSWGTDFSRRANSKSPSLSTTPSNQETPSSTPPQDLQVVKPTIPSIRQRTAQACDKCRERKTKCSGHRPVCVRCTNRGLICQYSTREVSRMRGPIKPRIPIPLNRISPHGPLDVYYPGQSRPTPALHSRMGGCRTDAFARPPGFHPATFGPLGQQVSRSLRQGPLGWQQPSQSCLPGPPTWPPSTSLHYTPRSDLYPSTIQQRQPDEGDLDLSLNCAYNTTFRSATDQLSPLSTLGGQLEVCTSFLPVPRAFNLEMLPFGRNPGPSLRMQMLDSERDFASAPSSSGMSTPSEQFVPSGLPSYSQDNLSLGLPPLPVPSMGAYWDVSAQFDVGDTNASTAVDSSTCIRFDSPASDLELELEVVCPAPIVPFTTGFVEDVKMDTGHQDGTQDFLDFFGHSTFLEPSIVS